MKKLFKYFLVAVTAIPFLVACNKDYLSNNTDSYLDASLAITNIPNMRAAVNGLYSVFANSDYYGRTAVLLPDLMADNVIQSVQTGTRFTNFDRTGSAYISSSDTYLTNLWQQLYVIIVNANTIINKAPNFKPVSQDSVEYRQLIGEAYTARSLAYFDLARYYCKSWSLDSLGIPIVFDSYPSDTSQITFPVRAKTVRLVYAQCLSDLDSAMLYLPAKGDVYNNRVIAKSSFRTRFNIVAAQGLASRINLYNQNYTNAIKYANMVLADTRYHLLDTASIINGFYTQSNSESIFEIANTQFNNQGSNSIAYIYNQNGYGEMLATKSLYDTAFNFSDKDPRRRFMVMGDRNSFGGERNVPLPVKYININNYQENIKILRLAELYLIKAEAEANLADNDNAVADLQSFVTFRNSSTVVPDVTATTRTIVNSILLERRKEFCFEGHRLFDLKRTRSSFYKFRAGNTALSLTGTRTRCTLQIPFTERNRNPNLVAN